MNRQIRKQSQEQSSAEYKRLKAEQKRRPKRK